MKISASEKAYNLLTSEDDGRVCKDIPESACDEQPKSFIKHLMSLIMSKSADGLVDPKLILSWLITHLGASSFFLGLLVPIREAGALLPQLFTAQYLRSLKVRKWVWTIGAFIQGLSALSIAISAIFLEGNSFGWAVVISLITLSLARSLCSVSYKDVLGKTISKSKRGTTTGLATSISAGVVIVFAALLTTEIFEKQSIVILGLFLASILWLFASFVFSTLFEAEGATEGGGNPISIFHENIDLLKSDKQLRLFITTRALLVSSALAPPFMVALTNESSDSGSINLGILLFASSLASLLSSYIWGRLADKSSRLVLLISGAVSCIALLFTNVSYATGTLSSFWALPLFLFTLMIAYQGVRLGRSTYLVDMASEENRAMYTALSNTIIGIFLLVSAVFGYIASSLGIDVVLYVFATMAFGACITAYKLDEVQ